MRFHSLPIVYAFFVALMLFSQKFYSIDIGQVGKTVLLIILIGFIIANSKNFRRGSLKSIFIAFLFYISFLLPDIFGGRISTILPRLVNILIVICVIVSVLVSFWDKRDFKKFNEYIGLLFVWSVVPTYLLFGDRSLQMSYYDGLQNIDFRLQGITPHANYLAEVICLYIIGLLVYREESKIIWAPKILFSFLLLVLTQSKTSMAAIMVSLLFIISFISILKNYRRFTASYIFIAIPVVCSSLYLSFMYSLEAAESYGSYVERTQIWQQSLSVWFSSIWFGVGSYFWSDEMNDYTFYIFGKSTSHAHNQFLQILGEAGIFGIVTFAVFLLSIFKLSLRSSLSDRMPTLCLFVFAAIIFLSEAPIRSEATGVGAIIVIYACLLVSIRYDNVYGRRANIRENIPKSQKIHG